MLPSWPEFWGKCKSSLAAIGRECFLTRAIWRDRARHWRRVARRLEQRVARLKSSNEELKRSIEKIKTERLEPKTTQPTNTGITQPDSIKPDGCHYSASEIELAVNLARRIGFRPAVHALKVFYKWLTWDNQVPTYQTIRTWSQRTGLDRTEHAKKIHGATWMLDHTCQTGREKVLTIVRVRPNNSLNKQQPLKFSDLELLAEVSRSTWTDDDVYQVLRATSEKYGNPGAVLSDQAHNLQKPALNFQNTAKEVHVLVDFKHFLANQFKLMLQEDADYPEFTRQLQHTCACVQQTELSHFVPRPMKLKARFMNLGPIFQWAQTMLWHLNNPDSPSRAHISQERMEEKFGWLRDLDSPISRWQQCQEVIDLGVDLINKHGLTRSTASEFQKLTKPVVHDKLSRDLVKRATKFLKDQAAQLREGETIPMSTEVLESLFARFKALEGQHSKEGFSSLLLALGTLLRPVTKNEVLRAFARTKCKDVSQWVQTHLGSTYTSKRQGVFRDARNHQNKPTRNRATAIAA